MTVPARERMLLWSIDETSGFDHAWVTVEDDLLRARGGAAGLAPREYSLTYYLETADAYAHRRITVEARWAGGSASLDLRRDGDRWTANGRSARTWTRRSTATSPPAR